MKPIVKGLAIFGGSVLAVTSLSALFNPGRAQTRAWYHELDKPALSPPDWVFGPVWTTLYMLIALAGYRVWKEEESEERTNALRWWTAQLLVNGAWSPIFFGAKRPALALADISLMLATISAFIATSRKVDKGAAWMFTPYLAWVTFATYLNAEIVRLNAK